MRLLTGPDRYRRSLGRGGQERTSRNPGCPTSERRAVLAGSGAFPTLQGSKTSEAERLPEARRDVTIARDPPGSGASRPLLRVLWFRKTVSGPLVTGGLPRTVVGTCQLCARSKRRSGSPSALGVGRSPLRYEADQATGRRPYLVTGAAVFRGSLHAHTLRDKDVGGAFTSAGTFQECYADEDLTCDCSGCADRPCACVTGGRPPQSRRLSFRPSSDAVQE